MWSPEIKAGINQCAANECISALKRYQPLSNNIPVQKSDIINQKPRIQFIARGDNRKTIKK